MPEIRPIPLNDGSPTNLVPRQDEDHKIWGTFFAFILVFLGWDTWDAWLDYLIEEAHHKSIIRPLLNIVLLSVSVPIIKGKGNKNPRVKAACSVLSAVAVWDILEYLVELIVCSKREAMFFYGFSLLVAFGIVKFYERRNNYDIIGNHLGLLA